MIPPGKNSGAFPARSAGNRAFRSKSSELPMQFLWAFRCNPLRAPSGSSKSNHEIANGNFMGAKLPLAILHVQPGGRGFAIRVLIRNCLKSEY
jgi:hypothetical protein